MKKIFALILILLITALVVVMVGAGLLVLNEGKRALGIPVCWINKVTESKKGAEEEGTDADIDLLLLKNKIIIESGSFDINIKYVDPAGNFRTENKIYVIMNSKVMGFTSDENPKVEWSVKNDAVRQAVVISTTQPNGWLFANRCSLDIEVTHPSLSNLEITTNGKVKVDSSIQNITNLSITSNNNSDNNAMVYCRVGSFTLNNPNGSGNYETFNGNLIINSKYGAFTFKQINGNVKATGTSMDLTIDNLVGDLDYNVEYGRGNFGTIGKSARFVSKGTDVVAKKINGSITVESGGDSTFDIKNNGTTHLAHVNVINMNKGKFKLANSFYKTTVKAVGGSVEIVNAKDIVEINPKTAPDAIIDSKTDVVVSFASKNEIDNAVSGNLLTINTKGKITATKLVNAVNIVGLDNKQIYLEFTEVNKNSTVTSASGEIVIKVPNNQNFKVEATTKKPEYVNFGVSTGEKVLTQDASNGLKTMTYVVGDSALAANTIKLNTYDKIKISSIQVG